jgi:hypothetical protein
MFNERAGFTLRDELQRLLKEQNEAMPRIKERVAKQSDKLTIPLTSTIIGLPDRDLNPRLQINFLR